MDHVIQTDGLMKRYGRLRALDGLDMGVPRGSIYGLVGRNGAGKTTLLRLLCGLQRPDGGSFSVNARRGMGAVVEKPGLYPDMTAAQNLRQQLRLLGRRSFEGIPALLELAGLQTAGGRRVGRFSLGMKQRLGIAMALAGEPDLLLLDEPTNGLDPQGMQELRALIQRLNRERGTTVLISSHNLGELSRLATHYGIIDQGRMVRQISAADLDAACEGFTRLTVNDTAALARALDRMKARYRVLSDASADVYTEFRVTPLVMALAGEGCEVIAMQRHETSLEDYFFSLVGGEGA